MKNQAINYLYYYRCGSFILFLIIIINKIALLWINGIIILKNIVAIIISSFFIYPSMTLKAFLINTLILSFLFSFYKEINTH